MDNNHSQTINKSWFISQIKEHKGKLIFANIVAIIATFVSVPIPLMMPLMVDEVLLNKPASGIDSMNHILPEALQTPTGYIALAFLFIVLMRAVSQIRYMWWVILQIQAGSTLIIASLHTGGMVCIKW